MAEEAENYEKTAFSLAKSTSGEDRDRTPCARTYVASFQKCPTNEMMLYTFRIQPSYSHRSLFHPRSFVEQSLTFRHYCVVLSLQSCARIINITVKEFPFSFLPSCYRAILLSLLPFQLPLSRGKLSFRFRNFVSERKERFRPRKKSKIGRGRNFGWRGGRH